MTDQPFIRKQCCSFCDFDGKPSCLRQGHETVHYVGGGSCSYVLCCSARVQGIKASIHDKVRFHDIGRTSSDIAWYWCSIPEGVDPEEAQGLIEIVKEMTESFEKSYDLGHKAHRLLKRLGCMTPEEAQELSDIGQEVKELACRRLELVPEAESLQKRLYDSVGKNIPPVPPYAVREIEKRRREE